MNRHIECSDCRGLMNGQSQFFPENDRKRGSDKENKSPNRDIDNMISSIHRKGKEYNKNITHGIDAGKRDDSLSPVTKESPETTDSAQKYISPDMAPASTNTKTEIDERLNEVSRDIGTQTFYQSASTHESQQELEEVAYLDDEKPLDEVDSILDTNIIFDEMVSLATLGCWGSFSSYELEASTIDDFDLSEILEFDENTLSLSASVSCSTSTSSSDEEVDSIIDVDIFFHETSSQGSLSSVSATLWTEVDSSRSDDADVTDDLVLNEIPLPPPPRRRVPSKNTRFFETPSSLLRTSSVCTVNATNGRIEFELVSEKKNEGEESDQCREQIWIVKEVGFESKVEPPGRTSPRTDGMDQRFRIGTRVLAIENKTPVFGTATDFDPKTGHYSITFDDGEYQEFNDEEMKLYVMLANIFPISSPKPKTD